MAGRRHVWYRSVLALVLVAGTAAVWARLPETMPVHWELSGKPDRFGSRVEGALLLPLLFLGIWGLTELLPRIDPRRANFAKMRGAYDLAISASLTMLLVMQGVILATALGYRVPMHRIVPATAGVLFLVLGNLLPRARPNWWFGIRTPWTLSSDRVWARTHRVGGYCMAGAGVLLLVAAFLPTSWFMGLFVGVVVPAALVPVVYSYFAWRQEHRT